MAKEAYLPARTRTVGYDPTKAFEIVKAIMAGDTLKKATKDNGITPATWYNWCVLYPELKTAYQNARELSAEIMEDKALEAAEKLTGDHDYSGPYITGLSAAMNQFRWSAERRDHKKYGPKQGGNTFVPIQINTTLDLGNTDANGESTFSFEVPDYPQKAIDESPETPLPSPDAILASVPAETPKVKSIPSTVNSGNKPGRPKGWRKGHRKPIFRTKARITELKKQGKLKDEDVPEPYRE